MGRRPLISKARMLEVIATWAVEHDVPPTIEELRRLLRVGSTRTILRYLKELEAEGHIRRWPGARGLQPLKVPNVGTETTPVPIVGEAPAGPLMSAEENLQGWVRLPRSFVKPTANHFLLRVRGDSMNRAKVAGTSIQNGDLVLVRQQVAGNPGDVVVAVVDGEATIKRLVRGPGYWLLKPESTNPKHQPILVDRDFRVQGVVCRVLNNCSELL